MSTYDTYEKSLDPTPREHQRWGRFGEETKGSVADAVRFCEEQGLDPESVNLGHNYVTWTAVETPEEIEQRIAHGKRSRASHLKAIKEMHDEYAKRGLYR